MILVPRTHVPILSLVIIMATLGPTAPAARWISTSPQLTEWLFELGAGDSLVGTSDYSDAPQAARAIPRLGPLFAPSIERTLQLRPDRVYVDLSVTPGFYLKGLDALHLEHEELKLDTLSDLMMASEKLIQKEQLVPGAQALERIKTCLTQLKATSFEPFSFLALAWTSPPIVFSQNTLLSNLLTLLGGKNLFSQKKARGFPQVSLDWIWAQRPERVYFLSETPRDLGFSQTLFGQRWPDKAPDLVALPTAVFSHASFSPLFHLKRLLPKNEPPLPKACRDLAL